MNEKFEKVIDLFKERTKKDCYKIICLDDEPSIMDNKIGGVPYYPIHEVYPVDKDGNPMALLLQVNLAEIDLEDYPKEGILEVFIDSKLNWPCQYVIKYFKEGLEYQKDLPVVSLDDFITKTPIKITFEKNICHMAYGDYRFLSVMKSIVSEIYDTNISTIFDLDDVFKDVDDWYDKFIDVLTIHGGNIGGYPDFTQTDPRDDIIENYEECLFKIDSNLSKKIMIGDSGILFGLIAKENIKNKNFENMFVDWDCC